MDNVLGESQREHPALATVYRWNRGKAAAAPGDSAPAARPNVLQRAAGMTIYNLGFVGYFLVRFVNLAIFGVAAVWVAIRTAGHRSKTAWAAIAAIAAFGFGVPCLFSWGHTAAGRWYETPNIYRLSDCGYVVLLLVGVPVLFRAIREWRRVCSWDPTWAGRLAVLGARGGGDPRGDGVPPRRLRSPGGIEVPAKGSRSR